VSKKGDISDVKVMRGVPDCTDCDKEAVRVVKNMPLWRPGRVKGKAVNSYYNLPVKFEVK
jgi:protein TonB